MKRVLIVDDNDKYAINLKKYFDSLGIYTDRAIDAKQGLDFYLNNEAYDMIVSDITMETQTSGLWMMRKIAKSGYKGVLAIASTGFDAFGVMRVSSVLLAYFCQLDWMIPKIPLKAGKVKWFPTLRTKNLNPPC